MSEVKLVIILCSCGIRFPLTNQKIIKELDTSKKIIIVSQASETPNKTAESEKECFISAGFNENNIFILHENDDSSVLNEVEYIYATGGNTFKLLNYLNTHRKVKSTIIQKVVSGKVTYIGESAGACICSPNIEYCCAFDDNNYNSKDYDGLGLTDRYIICHSDMHSFADMSYAKSFILDKDKLLMVNNNEVIAL